MLKETFVRGRLGFASFKATFFRVKAWLKVALAQAAALARRLFGGAPARRFLVEGFLLHWLIHAEGNLRPGSSGVHVVQGNLLHGFGSVEGCLGSAFFP
jgi:hypothetical protein